MNEIPSARSSWNSLLLALVGALVVGCQQDEAEAADAAAAAREIRDLVTALTPAPATAVPVAKSEHFANRKSTLERLRGASKAHGLAALRAYEEETPDLPEVRAGLLDIAAHTAPEASADLIVELVTTFGEDLLVRRKATELLGSCLPERALEVLEPILRERLDDRTYPPEETMLESWIQACESLGADPVPLLVLVAIDLDRPQEARHLATRTLGLFPSPQGRQALENLLVESSGNGYIRRLALQALLVSVPKKTFCELASSIQGREADTQFILFIQDALDTNCR